MIATHSNVRLLYGMILLLVGMLPKHAISSAYVENKKSFASLLRNSKNRENICLNHVICRFSLGKQKGGSRPKLTDKSTYGF